MTSSEVRREELEKLSREVEDALDRNNTVEAAARAAKGLEEFPNDSRLLRLKALADKQREDLERRLYVENHVSLARRLLEEKKSSEALAAVEEPLGRYPDDFALRSVYWLITDSIQQDRVDHFRKSVISRAREAIQRKAYNEAIDIVQAARQQTSTEDFDSLLQMLQESAANYATRQRIDAVLNQAQRLTSADDYSNAIELLDFTLREVDDPELRAVLESERLLIEQFQTELTDVLADARRMLHLQLHSEAVRFLEGHAGRFGKSSDFSRLREQARLEQRRRIQAFSFTQEHARDALEASDFETARAILDKYRTEFGDTTDSQLLEKEILAKQSAATKKAVAQALKDCRVLRFVGAHQAIVDILDGFSSAVVLVPAELRREYEVVHATALDAVQRERLAKQQQESINQRLAEDADQSTLAQSWGTTIPGEATKNPEQETQLAHTTELENVLQEVTLILDHYREDQRIQTIVSDVRHNLTLHIAALRENGPTGLLKGT